MNEIVPFIGIFLFYKKLRKVDRAKSIRLRLPGVILSALLCPKGKKRESNFFHRDPERHFVPFDPRYTRISTSSG